MSGTREQVMSALFTRLQARVTGLKTTSRAYLDPTSLQAEEQPALLLLADNYTGRVERGRPRIWTINAVIIVYVKALEDDANPEAQVNALIDLVENALKRDPQEAVTDQTNPYSTNLGGLCSRCDVAGTIDLIPGEVGGQAAAMIPVEILMA
jgi:hypothetical protein